LSGAARGSGRRPSEWVQVGLTATYDYRLGAMGGTARGIGRLVFEGISPYLGALGRSAHRP